MQIRVLSIILCGFLTPILKQFIPIAGEGASLIFVLSIPVLIGLSFVLALGYYFLCKKSKSILKQNISLTIFLLTLIGLALVFYPYAN